MKLHEVPRMTFRLIYRPNNETWTNLQHNRLLDSHAISNHLDKLEEWQCRLRVHVVREGNAAQSQIRVVVFAEHGNRDRYVAICNGALARSQ